MRRSPSRLEGIAGGIAVAAFAHAPAARAEAPPIRVDYHAHDGCPDAAVLRDEIARRTPLARFAGPSEPALAVEAQITWRGGESRGHLAIGAGPDRVQREIASASCDEVVSAFALITALAVDPRASTSPHPPPAPVPPPAASVPSLPSLSASPRPAMRRGDASPAPELVPPPLPALLAPASAGTLVAPGYWLVGARAAVSFGVTPRPLPGGGLFLERDFDPAARASLRLAVELAATGAFDIGPAGASFWQATLRVDGCALGQRLLARVTLAPCVRVEGGALGGAGVPSAGIVRVQTATVPWFGIGIVPRFSLDLARIVVELDGGPTFPLVRRTFQFDRPAYLVHDVPPVVWSVSVGAGVRFP